MAKTKLTFEQALEELEKIVAQIESGKVPLEESIEKYAQGQELIKQCRTILDTAEKKIQVLSETQGQSLAVSDQMELDDADPQEPGKASF